MRHRSQTISSNIPNTGTQKTCYVYDRLRPLTRAWTPNAASTCQTAPSAGTMGGVAPMWNDYTYNSLNGNRTGLTYHSATGAASTVSYTYPTATSASPHAVTTVAGPTDLGAGTYGYDAAGNMTSAPGQTITFDDVGKVTKVVAGSVTVSNIYDASGNLLLRTSSGSEGSSLYVGDTVLSQAKGSTVVAGFRTYSGPEGKPVAQRSAKTGTAGTVFTWLFSNHDGAVDTQTVAKTGATTRSYRDPFGVPIGGSTGVWANGNGFLNKPVVGSTKLTPIGARTYAAVIGKFISVDPITDPSNPQQNMGYAYAHNNPVTLNDPSGLRPDECGPGGVQCANSKVGGQWVPVQTPQGEYDPRPHPTPEPGPFPGRQADRRWYMSQEERQADWRDQIFASQLQRMDEWDDGAIFRVARASSDPEWRIEQNRKLTAYANGLVERLNLPCQQASNGLNVCQYNDWLSGGTTIGEVFITRIPIQDAVNNDALMSHEQVHSVYEAAYGSQFFVFYLEFQTESLGLGFGPACANVLESVADFAGGNYVEC